jgi:hypothetical protein
VNNKSASARSPVPTTDTTPAAGLVKPACDPHDAEMLLGMRERVELVGGSFAVVSAPGRGTTIRARIPFHNGA